MSQWIISSSVLILLVLALRLVLKRRVTARVRYALWLLVLLRLLIPHSIGASPLSVANFAPESAELTQQVQIIGRASQPELEALPDGDREQAADAPVSDGVTAAAFDLSTAAGSIWLLGAGLVLAAASASNAVFALRLRRGRKVMQADCTLPVYIFAGIASPCLAGLFRPAIYITPELAADQRALKHVLEHEKAHYRHGDHIWARLRCVCLALHWYNPLVWLAAELSRRDAELACDEAAVERMGEGERFDYGRTLIALTCPRRSGLLGTAIAMTGSRRSIRERVSFLANRPRMAVLTLIAALLLTLAAAGCTFTGDSRDEAGTPAPAEVSPEPTAAAAPMPQRYTRSFGSADGTVKYSMDLSLDEAAAETMPTLKLKPRAISEAEAKSTVRLVLGDAELYGCDAEDYSKEELERYLDVVKLLRDDGELRQRLYGDSAAQERIANLLAKYDTQSVYDAAPYDSERPPLDWSYLPDGNARRTITGKAELDGWRYYLSATDDQRESGLQRGVWVYLDAGYLASVPYEYYCYALAADSVPAAEQVDYAAAKAQRIIDGLDIGQWQIVLSGAQETYGGRYNIYVDAAPVFDGYPVLHRSYDEYYHQRNIGFTFGADGTLIHFLLVNPSEAAEYISAGDSVLSIAEAAEIAEKALTGVSKEAFDISYVTVDGSLQYGVRSEVTVDSVSYGYAQVPTEGGKGESVLTPIISFSGHFEAYDEAGKPVFSSAERGFTEVINLNAIDGSVLSIGYMPN